MKFGSRRQGFSLVEVLIASTIMAIALLGIGDFAFVTLRSASRPKAVESAVMLAQERLDYFRNQENPYLSAGGTYFAPPDNRFAPDYNTSPDGDKVNIAFNGPNGGGTSYGPRLFVREFLADVDEGHFGGDVRGDLGKQGQSSRSIGGDATYAGAATDKVFFGLNEIPPTGTLCAISDADSIAMAQGGTPATLVRTAGVIPNNNDATPMATYPNKAHSTVITAVGQKFYYTVAPRANDAIRYGSTIPPQIKYVREVWVQTNNPNFNSFKCPITTNLMDNTGSASSTNGPDGCFRPNAIDSTSLPPFMIAVTVRVFLRLGGADPSTGQYTFKATSSAGAGVPVERWIDGPGYAQDRPIAEAVGYVGLRRALDPS